MLSQGCGTVHKQWRVVFFDERSDRAFFGEKLTATIFKVVAHILCLFISSIEGEFNPIALLVALVAYIVVLFAHSSPSRIAKITQ